MNMPNVDADRLWSHQLATDRIGATPAGGVHRMALTDEDIASHRLIADWALARGWTIEIDDIGNMFMTRVGSDPTLPPVASGSHTDSQPMAGRFDGMSGTLAAFEALEAIDDAGIATVAPLEVAIWNNEEGPRFNPACMGSAVYAGVRGLDSIASAEHVFVRSNNTVDFYLRRGFRVAGEVDPDLFALEPEDIHLECELAS